VLPVLSAEYDFTSFLEIRQLPCPAPGRKNLEALSNYRMEFPILQGFRQFFLYFFYTFMCRMQAVPGIFPLGAHFFVCCRRPFNVLDFLPKKQYIEGI